MEEEKTYAQMRKEYYEKYSNKFVPLCKEEFESERVWRLILVSIIAVVGAVIFLIYCVFAYSAQQFDFNIPFGIFGATYALVYMLKKNFERKIKMKIMPAFCKCFGDFYWHSGSYDSKCGLFTRVGLVGRYNKEKYDDIFCGTFKNVNINVIECKLQMVKKSGKNKSVSTIFNGAVIKLDMNKSFKCHTVIKPNSLFHMSPISGLRHTELEDVVFEKKYDVYTNDEVEARVLISPAFMERLNNLKTAFKVDKISCSFYHDKLFIALHTRRDLFSIGSLVCPVHKGRQWADMFEEFLSIIKIIEYFKLNDRLLL